MGDTLNFTDIDLEVYVHQLHDRLCQEIQRHLELSKEEQGTTALVVAPEIRPGVARLMQQQLIPIPVISTRSFHGGPTLSHTINSTWHPLHRRTVQTHLPLARLNR